MYSDVDWYTPVGEPVLIAPLYRVDAVKDTVGKSAFSTMPNACDPRIHGGNRHGGFHDAG